MTSKELRLKCLLEAADLLAESAGANGLAKRLSDKGMLYPQAKDTIDRLDQYKKRLTKIHARDKKINDIVNRMESFRSKMTPEQLNKLNMHQTERERKRDEFSEHREYTSDMNKRWRKAIEDELSAHSKKSAPIHNKINNRVKSQNETIEILLNEAYDLLDEAAARDQRK